MDRALDPRQQTVVERLVRGQLTSSDADRTALVGLIEELVAADDRLAEVGPSVGALLRSAIAADAVTAAFTTSRPADDVEDAYAPDDVLRIGRIRGQASAMILSEPMLDATRAALAMGSRSSNPREYARQLRARPDVLALPVGNRFVFPAFQFNPSRRELWPGATDANRLLGAADDPWAVASWWFSVDPRLDARPADVVADVARTGDLRAAVERELAPIG